MKHTLLLKTVLAFLLVFTVFETKSQVTNTLIPCQDAVVTCYGYGDTAVVAGIKRVGNPVGAMAPYGNNWVPPPNNQTYNPWRVLNIGQVFGIALDSSGSVYLSASSMYYNPNFNSPSLTSVRRLARPSTSPYVPYSPANFYSGYNLAGGPAGIYVSRPGSLNQVSVLTSSSTSSAGTGLGTNKIYDRGFGIGNICSDQNYIYASLLDDGAIYKINSQTGIIDQIYDPFGIDVSGSSIAPYNERITAVAVNQEPGGSHRLYFAVVTDSFHSSIYSVALLPNGNMSTTDLPSLEVDQTNTQHIFYISDIAFSTKGNMLVAQKGEPHLAYVYEYRGQHGAWSLPYLIPTGSLLSSSFSNSAGGVDYAAIVDSSRKRVCDTLIWATANYMRDLSGSLWYGLQGVYSYIPPPPTNARYILDLDAVNGGGKGLFGDFEFYSACCQNTSTQICDLITVDVVSDTQCCHSIQITNDFDSTYFRGVILKSNGGLTITTSSVPGNWGTINYVDPTTVQVANPQGNMPMGKFDLGIFCLDGNTGGSLDLYFIGNGPQFDTVCVKTIKVGCGTPQPAPTCIDLVHELRCKDGNYELEFTITNLSNWTMRGVTITPLSPGIKTQIPYLNIFVPIADLAPGATATYTTTVAIDDTVTNACFYYSVCDINVRPYVSGTTPQHCCMDSIIFCAPVPTCDPCDAISFTVSKQDSTTKDCCYNLDLTNNLTNSQISCVRFNGINGTQFALFGTSWNIQAPVSSSKIELCSPGGVAPVGSISNFVQVCLTGTSVSPHQIHVEYLGTNGELICDQILEFKDCDLVPSNCLQIVNDSLYCVGGEQYFTFDVLNNSPFDVYQIDVRPSDSTVITSPSYFQLDSPLTSGVTTGPFTIHIDTADQNLDFLCISLTAHNARYDSLTGQGASICCTDSLGGICLPFISCDSISMCCDVNAFVIPNGLTPNADGYNDELLIKNTNACEYVRMTVFNRWGNIVYENPDYQNDWKGENSSGDLLPQGTYYILLEVANGGKKGIYVDLRY